MQILVRHDVPRLIADLHARRAEVERLEGAHNYLVGLSERLADDVERLQAEVERQREAFQALLVQHCPCPEHEQQRSMAHHDTGDPG